MLASAGEPGTIARALDFHQTLGAATHCADLFAERRAAAARASHAAERTDHVGHYCIIRPKSTRTHRNAPCNRWQWLSRRLGLYESNGLPTRIGRRILQGSRGPRADSPGRRHPGAHVVLRRAAARRLSTATRDSRRRPAIGAAGAGA